MAVGSVGIGAIMRESRNTDASPLDDNRPDLEPRLGRDEFDLTAIGRLHLADANLAQVLRDGSSLPEFRRAEHERALV